MAVLTPTQFARLRNAFQEQQQMAGVTKPQLNAAFQQIEDWFEASRASLGAAITGGFTPAQKKALVAQWLLQKFEREV